MKHLIKILIVVIIGLATNEIGYSTEPITTILPKSVNNLKSVEMNTENEIWKDITGYEGYYQVSNQGRIKSVKRIGNGGIGNYNIRNGKVIKPNEDKHNYLSVMVCMYGNTKRISLHRSVAIAFIPNPENLPEVNHKDGDKSNNNDWNLEWCTSSYNKLHAYKIGLRTAPNIGKKGIESARSKEIEQFDLIGNFINRYCSSVDAMVNTNVCNSAIGKCAKGVYKTAGGFIWKYIS